MNLQPTVSKTPTKNELILAFVKACEDDEINRIKVTAAWHSILRILNSREINTFFSSIKDMRPAPPRPATKEQTVIAELPATFNDAQKAFLLTSGF